MKSVCTGNLCFVFLALVLSISVIVFALFYSNPGEKPSPTNSSGTRVSDTLKFVVVLSRHGNRQPLHSLPNESVHWIYGEGQLTTHGHIQAYNLGVKIRSLYNEFLNTEYRSTDIHAASTPVDRTIMSGQLFLAGLYPPRGYQVWNDQLGWQPTPLYSNSPDKTWTSHKTCPRFIEESNVTLTAYEQEVADNLTSVNRYLSQHMSYNLTTIYDLYNVWDALTCEEQEGFAIPEWVKPVYPQPISELIGGSFVAWFAQTPSLIRLSIGLLFQEMRSAMMSKVNGSLSPDRKLYYYSGHDVSIISLQALLGVPKPFIINLVQPSSALIMEVHQNTGGKFYVEMLYLDGSSPSVDPKMIISPECGNPCEFDTLVNFTQKYTNISNNYDQECQINTTKTNV